MQPTDSPTAFERTRNWLNNSITLRLLVIGLLILIMLIPVNMVESLIRERQYRQTEAQDEISLKWGYPQTIGGLLLSVPYTVYNTVKREDKEEVFTSTAFHHFLPEELVISGDIDPEVRYRGIFETTVYASQLSLSGHFNLPREIEISDKRLRWNEAVVSFGISDLRSIRESVALNWDEKVIDFNPGLPSSDVLESGINAEVDIIWDEDEHDLKIPFSVELDIRGSEYLHFLPLGKTTDVSISSDWNAPAFGGAFLPASRDITDKGFEASWRVLNLNRTYPQQFKGSAAGIADSAFGVTLMFPVDHYQKSTRAAKYAVLFITLTFVVFFFIQIMAKVRIHPIQYLLVGFALCLFYTLLIAVAEHIRFGWSYLIAAMSTVSLIVFYAHGTFKKAKLTAVLAAILTLLYGYIFSIIQLHDFALLAGSIGLFFALSVLMYVTRKIDWYNSGEFTSKRRVTED